MTDSVSDADRIELVLERLSWERAGSSKNQVTYWRPPESDRTKSIYDERLIIPSDASASDYLVLLDEAMTALRNRYGGEFEEVVTLVTLLVTKHLDELTVRKVTDNNFGLIDWKTGNQLVDSTRGMLAASAKSAQMNKKRFAQAHAVIAENFLDDCYMGQTRVGSYVVTALTPASKSFAITKGESADAKKQPRISGRDITTTLVQSLAAVKDAITESTSNTELGLSAFEDHIKFGVSYELLAALEPIAQTTESDITVELTPQPRAARDSAPPSTHKFAFTPEDAVFITKARTYFEAAPLPSFVVVSGEVVLLKNSESDAEHQIKVHTRLDGRPRTILANLSPDQYERAVEAHRTKHLLTVTGELEHRTRGSIIGTPEVVRVETTPVSHGAPADAGPMLWDSKAETT